LVILCFENVSRSECCHRTWFADWIRDRLEIEVTELDECPLTATPTLFNV
jgi:hypothetical protein